MMKVFGVDITNGKIKAKKKRKQKKPESEIKVSVGFYEESEIERQTQ